MNEGRAEQAKPQPAPAVGQVWELRPDACPAGWRRPAGFAIESVRPDGEISFGGGLCGYPAALLRCIGITTPAGRVMVGERRQRHPFCPPVEVIAVIDDGRVLTCSADGLTGPASASVVASWPLLSPAPAERKPEARESPAGVWARMAKDNARQPFATREDVANAPRWNWDFAVIESTREGFDIYRRVVEVANRAIRATGGGPRFDPREQGPGLAARPVRRPTVAPDVVWCERWEAWALP